MFKILIVEDDTELCQLFSHVLEKNGYHTRMVSNGQEALDALAEEYVDLIISDIMMPVMDGLEATRRIRSVSADVPIIAMSAYSSGSEIESARNAGCNEFLVKPLSQYSLHRALNAALVEFKGKGKS